MWISWWTYPLRKVLRGTYDSSPAVIVKSVEIIGSVWSHRPSAASEARPSMSQRSMPPSSRLAPGTVLADPPPPDIADFISFCHARKHVGWPELYDEMCAVASRREFNGWDHDQFAAHGLTFSLFEMTRLSGWVRTVLALTPEPIDGVAIPSIRG